MLLVHTNPSDTYHSEPPHLFSPCILLTHTYVLLALDFYLGFLFLTSQILYMLKYHATDP